MNLFDTTVNLFDTTVNLFDTTVNRVEGLVLTRKAVNSAPGIHIDVVITHVHTNTSEHVGAASTIHCIYNHRQHNNILVYVQFIVLRRAKLIQQHRPTTKPGNYVLMIHVSMYMCVYMYT